MCSTADRPVPQCDGDPPDEASRHRRPRVVIRHKGRGVRATAAGTGHQVVVEAHDPVLPEGIDLGQQLVHGPVVVQPRIGSRPALPIAGLRPDAGPGIGLGEAAPAGEARHPDVFVSPDDHGEVIGRGQVQLDEQGHVVHHDRAGRCRLHERAGARTDQRVGDGLEILARLRVGKDDLAQRTAIQGAIGCHHRVTEAFADRSQAGRADRHDLARQLVGVDDHGPELAEPLCHGRFARADPTGESHAQHAPTLAWRPGQLSPGCRRERTKARTTSSLREPRRQVTSAASTG